MSRSKNSRRGSKHIKGCSGCPQCDHNRPERQLPAPDVATDAEVLRIIKGVWTDHRLEHRLLSGKPRNDMSECGQPAPEGDGFCDACWQSIMDGLQLDGAYAESAD